MLVRYNRQVNKRLVYLGCFEVYDFVWMVMGFGVLTATIGVSAAGVFVLGYLAFGLMFRLGKPPGYFTHILLKTFIRPQHRRPGRVDAAFPFDPRLTPPNTPKKKP